MAVYAINCGCTGNCSSSEIALELAPVLINLVAALMQVLYLLLVKVLYIILVTSFCLRDGVLLLIVRGTRYCTSSSTYHK